MGLHKKARLTPGRRLRAGGVSNGWMAKAAAEAAGRNGQLQNRSRRLD